MRISSGFVLYLFFASVVYGYRNGKVGGALCNQYKTQQNCPAGDIVINSVPPCFSHNGPVDNSTLVFAIVGDYGLASANCEGQVSTLVDAFETQFGPLDFVMTVGDNAYWTGSCEEVIASVEPYYGKYFDKQYGKCADPTTGATTVPKNPRNIGDTTGVKFFPTLGNHEWDTYFTYGYQNLPFYQILNYLTSFPPYNSFYNIDPTKFGEKIHLSNLVELFSVNSNIHNGNISDPVQQQWLKEALSNSSAIWKIVYFHHPPYTTAEHDPPATWMHWPFAEWGASIVLNGHEHDYERIYYENLTYVVNGLGGHPWLYEITGPECEPFPGSQVRYNGDHGAMVAFATKESLQFCFYSLENGVTKVDEFELQ